MKRGWEVVFRIANSILFTSSHFFIAEVAFSPTIAAGVIYLTATHPLPLPASREGLGGLPAGRDWGGWIARREGLGWVNFSTW